MRTVFIYVRGPIDAEDRKRGLIREREGALRLVEEVLLGLGQGVMAEGSSVKAPEVADIIDAVVQTHLRRDAAIADLAAAESLKASDDMKFAVEESNARNDEKACDVGAAELDELMRKIQDERREVAAQVGQLRGSSSGPDDQNCGPERAVFDQQHAVLERQFDALRERAAALRATTIAARAKLDQAIAARRQVAAAMTATLSAHARDRADAERQIRQLMVQLGRAAVRARMPGHALTRGYAHVARLEATIATKDRLIAGLQGTIAGADRRKLQLAVGVLVAILITIGLSLWASLR
jgi:hypothetical protein